MILYINNYKTISAKEALKPEEPIKEHTQNLRFMRVDEKSKLVHHENLLDYLDVYPYRYENSEGQAVTPWFQGRFCILGKSRVFSPPEVKLVSWDGQILHLPAYANKTEEYYLDRNVICLASLSWIRLVKENKSRQDDKDRHDIFLINQYLAARRVLEAVA